MIGLCRNCGKQLGLLKDFCSVACLDEYKQRGVSLVQAKRALDVQTGGNHYKKCKIQPIEYIQANNLDYIQGNIIKYATRYKDKGGKEDLEKIKHYCDLAIEAMEKSDAKDAGQLD